MSQIENKTTTINVNKLKLTKRNDAKFEEKECSMQKKRSIIVQYLSDGGEVVIRKATPASMLVEYGVQCKRDIRGGGGETRDIHRGQVR